tara:strand:- start:260 stop:1477 length:1218 start_codon:yes stop_codon:yes gene_type:complete
MAKGMRSMTTDKQQRSVTRANSLWLVLFALTSSLSVAQDNSPETDETAAPWYQVEVVIFTQQGYTGAEQPPRSYKLDFPQNNHDLLEPGQISDNNFPVAGNGVVSNTAARIIPLATVADPALSLPASEIDNLEEQSLEQNSPFDNYDLAQLNAQDAAFLASNPIGTLVANSAGTLIDNQTQTAEQAYVAKYEPTFVKLPRDVRNLNESARALDRQAQYNVLFHEAWRFSADKLEQDPWVIIKAGKQYLDRFEIEGSLRFYKSRFLHFQSDLWLLEFDSQSDTANMIELPEFPVREQASLGDSYVIAEIQFDKERIEDFFIDAPEKDFGEMMNLEVSDSELQAVEKIQQPRRYPVKTLWTFDQSKRLEEQQSYYIDHPKMGVLVTIIPYEPEVLNPVLEETLAEAE